MRIVFKIVFDPHNAGVTFDEDFILGLLEFGPYPFDGQEMSSVWSKPIAKSPLPRSNRPAFLACIKDTFGTWSNHFEPFRSYLEADCELLDATVNGEDFIVVNPTTILDCIVEERSERMDYGGGVAGHYIVFEFKKDKLKTDQIFRIEGNAAPDIFVCIDTESDRNLTREYERRQSTGLRFMPVWTSEGHIITSNLEYPDGISIDDLIEMRERDNG